jgi:hypothetical protein
MNRGRISTMEKLYHLEKFNPVLKFFNNEWVMTFASIENKEFRDSNFVNLIRDAYKEVIIREKL